MRARPIVASASITASSCLPKSGRVCRPSPTVRNLERAKEKDQVLLVLVRQAFEILDDLVGLAFVTLMRLDRFHEVGGAAVVQEEDALPQTPQRSGPEFISTGGTLRDMVSQIGAHVVQEKVGESIDLHVGLIGDERRRAGVDGRRVAEGAADVYESLEARLGL